MCPLSVSGFWSMTPRPKKSLLSWKTFVSQMEFSCFLMKSQYWWLKPLWPGFAGRSLPVTDVS